MKNIYLLFISTLFAVYSCGQTQKKITTMETIEHKYTNQLIHETSPYLLQHAHNPVNWYPWGEEALDKAKKENKLIIVSIGYAACHWCHVMEHESFESEEVAKFMNENYVAIKVDREERPDIDQVYMNAIQLLSGSGGWPLNCIILPDGRPIYGGTYFQKNQWLDMLQQVLQFTKNNPEKTEQQAKSLTEGIKASEIIYVNDNKAAFSQNDLDTIFENWKSSIDFKNGGYNRAPKFPLPVGYQFLLHYYFLTQNADALRAIETTLQKMADGGIYDQVGGGFSRYSVDEFWKVPHFEKMLYDNSQLISLYSSAYQQTKNPKYKTIVSESLAFIQRELTSPEGGFYSSLDADSEGEEGHFYVWKQAELKEVLGNKAEVIIDYFSVKENGNWEQGNNILFISKPDKIIADKHNITEGELNTQIQVAKEILLKERAKRIRPGLDDKILTSWNALMLKAYVDAYRVFDNIEYLNIALRNAEFINTRIKADDSRLYRNYKNGESSINAFLDDYAFTIEAFISLYQATFNQKWLDEAQDLTKYTLEHFYNQETGMFYYTSDIDKALIARKMELTDNVIPASNSVMAKNLFVLGHYLYNQDYISKSTQMLNNVKEACVIGGAYYANWADLMAWVANAPYEVAIVGKNFENKRKEFDENYLPNVFFAGGMEEGSLELLKNRLVKGQTTIYVCKEKVCKLPVTEVEEALKQVME